MVQYITKSRQWQYPPRAPVTIGANPRTTLSNRGLTAACLPCIVASLLNWLNNNWLTEMQRRSDNTDIKDGLSSGERVGRVGEGDILHLLRCSHIFASVIHEVLEVKLLQEATTLPVNISQFLLLKLMCSNGNHQIGEVASVLGVTPPAATKSIDKLERLGLVVRTPSKGDRRATLLSVSLQGRRLVRRCERLRQAHLSPAVERFKAEEIDQLASLLQRFSVALLDLERDEDTFCLRCAAHIEDDCAIGQSLGDCPYKKACAARDKRGMD